MTEIVDTMPHALKCRFCKQEATLGTWMYEAKQPEKTFVCHDCWNFITSLIADALPNMIVDFIQYGELQMKTNEVKTMRHVRVEKPKEVSVKA